MQFYDNSIYGFCETCRKTDVPALIEYPDGGTDWICPTCAEREYDEAESTETKMCWERQCRRIAATKCEQCDDPVCSTHIYAGYCSSCTSRHHRAY